MTKTREDVINDFYAKTGATKVEGSEKNSLGCNLFEALENIQLVDHGHNRQSKNTVTEQSQISGALSKILENQGIQLETNANEVHHTTNTGFGQELVPVNVLNQNVYDISFLFGELIPMLPSFHGNNMNLTEKVPVLGIPKFLQNNAEWTTGAPTPAQGNTKHATDDVTITQIPLIMTLDISKRLLNHSIVDIETLLKTKIGQSAARTFDAAIINGDTETGATGNVNSDDQAPATTFAADGGANYYATQFADGIVHLALGNSATVNVGTLGIDDFPAMLKQLGKYGSQARDVLFGINNETYIKALGLQPFYDASQRGAASTISGNAITNVFGSDVIKPYDLDLAEADGKKSATGSNNTLGRMFALYKPSVQYGFGQPIEIDVVRVPGKGIQLVICVEFGFTIASKKADDTNSPVALGFNITV